MSSQPTQSSKSNQSGNVSDATEVQTRRSSRVTTPMKRSGMIQPSPDSRRSITQPLLSERPDIDPSSQTKKRTEAPTDSDSTPQITPVQSQKPRNKKPTKKPKKTTGATSVGNSEANPGTTIDLAQDSDEENAKAKFKRQRKNLEEDDIKVFFSEPFRRKDDPADKPPSTYSCLWCKKEVRVSASSLSNLRVHRDGSRQTGRVSNGCPNRAKAIAAGAKLPQTALDEEKKKKGTQEITSHFARVEKFDNIILNRIVVLWLLRQAIPWNRVEDPYLQAAFNYCEPAANLFKRKWAATASRTAYLELQEEVVRQIKATNSKFNLIHDVWTTKGNRYGFIGVSASFIDNDWNYVVLHLSLKLVAWFHQGELLAAPIVNILKKHQLYNKINHRFRFE
ncbi:hypothetical protein PGT21_014212 [Puccinia graminis f. sp. tritici]|uniref:BED-type domain-containing protein n=1 Tax=Puccinia graminis f. sp. tritici TaxID=56615 RepID=A0A5B0NWC6_PUCGR|nr:hypothetical protein PGT21_019437 [Puccinia graminis f. sp. tritici]KAA1096367.1 hypothetical protein PGT21_014212 [Puccinia graminis f. sp. tritici]